MLQCEKLSENELTENLPQYADIFGDNVEKLAKIGRIIKAKHETFKKVLTQNEANAPSLSAAVSSSVSNNCDTYDCIGIKY